MTSLSIIDEWQAQSFRPIYWLEGPEDFFIDEVMYYAEHNLLTEDQASFNLTVFYGKDAEWAEVVNACQRYPVFSNRQVVLLKEGQQMRDLEKLEPYFEKPNEATTFVISYKGKTLDGRTRFSKVVRKNGVILTSKKIYDNQLPAWTNSYVQSKGFKITPKALSLLADHIGNDLSRITNEVNKLIINISPDKPITEEDIEKYIGISKDYNIFELQEALSFKNRAKAIRIVQYIDTNPKAFSAQSILPALYGYFTKLMIISQLPDKSENTLRVHFNNNPSAITQSIAALKNYSFKDMEQALILLHHYNLKTIGIDTYTNAIGPLLKELVYKIME
ncbi:MAG: DNA polymerase III subunit delta [Chitinophagaceae bacterium]|nr:DNA polymerase III subunit delta [Chitinophagaceae bacterium]MCW5914866.1 DNA polymerase III subunit delta [Chitinophagaceae bacterium]MCZ2396208.1 DNA polymerase III subunit delta [Chitinophagales bacterium]